MAANAKGYWSLGYWPLGYWPAGYWPVGWGPPIAPLRHEAYVTRDLTLKGIVSADLRHESIIEARS